MGTHLLKSKRSPHIEDIKSTSIAVATQKGEFVGNVEVN